MLPQEVLDEQAVAELAFMDLHSAVTDSDVIDRVLNANERYATTEKAHERVDRNDAK